MQVYLQFFSCGCLMIVQSEVVMVVAPRPGRRPYSLVSSPSPVS